MPIAVGNRLALEEMDVFPVSSSMREEQRYLEQTPRIQAFLSFRRCRTGEMSQTPSLFFSTNLCLSSRTLYFIKFFYLLHLFLLCMNLLFSLCAFHLHVVTMPTGIKHCQLQCVLWRMLSFFVNASAVWSALVLKMRRLFRLIKNIYGFWCTQPFWDLSDLTFGCSLVCFLPEPYIMDMLNVFIYW